MEELEQYLWSLTLEQVKALKRKLGLVGAGKIKRDIIESIMQFYRTPNWIEEYFSTLTGFDKEYATLIIQENFNPLWQEARLLREKYNIKSGLFGEDEDNLKFMIEGNVPEVFRPALLKLVPPIEVKFNQLENIEVDKTSKFLENSENPVKKFDDFLRFVNKNKVKASEKNKYISKSNILEFIKENSIQEITRNSLISLESIKSQDDTIIVNGIVSFLLCSSVIKIENNFIVLDYNYSKYIKLSNVEKAKFLLDSYINSHFNRINEIERLQNYTYKYDVIYDLNKPRKIIMDFVKKMPIEKWIKTDELKYFIRIKNMNFLRDNIHEILAKDDNKNWYYIPEFEELEEAFIDIVLIDFLAVLGIVDVNVVETENNYYTKYYLLADYVKLTDFGAKVLGLVDGEVEEIKESKPLIITPNFEIIIEDSDKRTEYELYFDRFFEKTFEDKEKSIFKFNFSGLAKSYDEGEFSLVRYIIEECKDIPPNVTETILKWTETLGQITIKTVTILEAPEKIIKELLKDSKIKKIEQKSELSHIIISSKKCKELKKLIESKEYFCEIENDD